VVDTNLLGNSVRPDRACIIGKDHAHATPGYISPDIGGAMSYLVRKGGTSLGIQQSPCFIANVYNDISFCDGYFRVYAEMPNLDA
jgi:hypothetical protein